MNIEAPRKWFDAHVKICERTISGGSAVQNLLHKNWLVVSGDERTIQYARPSAEHEAHRDGGQDEPRESEIEEREQVLKKKRREREVRRKHTEVVEINDDQSEQQKKLRPLGGIPCEGAKVFEEERAELWLERPGDVLEDSIDDG